jgi:two-component system, NarL family, invasion response regulator UvrY
VSGGVHHLSPADRPGTVLAVDDRASFLALLRDVVGATDSLTAVGEATSGEAAIDMAAWLRPDMVVMDVRMPGIGGIAAARRIRHEYPATVIVLVSTTHPDELGQRIHQNLADAVIWKSELEPGLLDAVWRRRRSAG